ncbi:flavin reductase family protein [Caulobacter sp. KR2-114]|uniref:flavin reductase family protein n=1 Tax=Caulobacter sp. KR2-114 TaxID=3400912 RepID=UPI003C0E1D34
MIETTVSLRPEPASPTAPARAPTPAEWRQAMGCFPTGVTIVTTWDDVGDALGADVEGGARPLGRPEPVGSTINAFCSVSLDPPLLLICLDLNNPIRRALERTRVFGVNILCSDSHGMAMRFATDPLTDRFTAFDWGHAEGGAPQLKAAPVFVDCQVQDIHTAGDHLVIIGRGVGAHVDPAPTPLLYHRGAFPKLGA